MKELEGQCLCGAVKYVVADEFKYAGYCHCSDCRRFSGSACSAAGGIPIAAFRVLKGRENIATFTKSENTILAFCCVCGSSLYAAKPKTNMMHLRLGTLNESPSLVPQFHAHVGSKATWDHFNDGLPQFEVAPPAVATQQRV